MLIEDNFENNLGAIGKQWFRSLVAELTMSRVDKGITDALQGAVKEWTINSKGFVTGKVWGIGDQQYEQIFQSKGVSDTVKQDLLTYLEEHPSQLAKLLQNHLPNHFIQEYRNEFFPQHWSDLNMACSCSNAQPCRHLIAIWAICAQQMKDNPYLLFELKGWDIATDLSQRGLLNNSEKMAGIPSIVNSIVSPQKKEAIDWTVVKSLDFSNLENQWKQYMRLLGSTKAFYDGNLKQKLGTALRKAYKLYQKKAFERNDSIHQQLKQSRDLALIVNTDNQLINWFLLGEEKNFPLFASDLALGEGIAVLETIEEGHLTRYPDALIVLHTIYRFSMQLLATQNLLPHLMQSANGYWIQWMPPVAIHKEVAILVEELKRLCSIDLLLLDADGLKHLSLETQVLNLCHLFVSYFIQLATETSLSSNRLKKIEYCFWSAVPVAFDGADEKNLPLQIHQWLQVFSLHQSTYVPVLKVLKAEEDVAFSIELGVQASGAKEKTVIPLAKFLKKKNHRAYQVEVLQAFNQLGQYFPDLRVLLEQEVYVSEAYSGPAFEQLFFEILPLLQLLNITIILPQALQQLTRPRLGLSIGAKREKSTKKSFLNIKSLLEANWNVTIGEEVLDVVEFFKLIKGKTGFIKHKERYIYLEQADLQRIFEQLSEPVQYTANQMVQAALSHRLGTLAVTTSEEAQRLIGDVLAYNTIPPPQTLKATLRPYQHKGYSWMYKNAQLGLGALIADDMGLGKTLQVISLLLKFKEEGKLDAAQALVVVPTSLMTNWINELRKFAPLLQPCLYHGAKRRLDHTADVIITTYGIARLDLNLLNEQAWYCLVIDEAQAIKNVNTGQTDAIKAIKASINIAMSGTPVENRLSEYWSIMDYVNPNYLGTIAEFTEQYAQPIEQQNDRACLVAFRKVTAPFILRRLKSDRSIIKDLPDKIETNCIANLQREQIEIYQKTVNDTLHELSKSKDDKKKRQGLILKLMGGLKQICNHPYQYLSMGRRGPECSGKSQVLMDLLKRIQMQQEKTLIFTQYRKMGNLMVQWIKERFGFEPMYLHGGCSRAQRDVMVDAFQNDRRQTIFILSLKAAGTGLNLTAANHVVHYDLWWNPAVEAQATDRAYRIGQQKNVQVYRFITKGTIEEKIDAMIQSKKELADMTVSLGDRWLGDLSDDELGELLSLESVDK